MIVQSLIAILELLAIWLINEKSDERKKFAPIFGLLGQPFWFYSSYEAEQWGAFVLCFFFTGAWIKGIKTYWFDKEPATLKPEEYMSLISDALDKVGDGSRYDYRDYVKRVTKEALKVG